MYLAEAELLDISSHSCDYDSPQTNSRDKPTSSADLIFFFRSYIVFQLHTVETKEFYLFYIKKYFYLFFLVQVNRIITNIWIK